MYGACIFCGSNEGNRPEYITAAKILGEALVEAGWGLVYGGGSTGMMGALADAVLAAGGRAVGVIPQIFKGHDYVHVGLHRLDVVEDMHRRKALMYEQADAFIALPGGLGTFEELLEALTWNQLRIHAKPCAILNTEGYYDPLLAQLRKAADEGFLAPNQLDHLIVETDAVALMARISSATSS